jgi:hypothetical protein
VTNITIIKVVKVATSKVQVPINPIWEKQSSCLSTITFNPVNIKIRVTSLRHLQVTTLRIRT